VGQSSTAVDTQDIRRKNTAGEHEVVIVFDPKGDADLLKRVWAEAHRAGRGDELTVFHLGWPDISARYNAVGRFGRVSEVATRVAGQLSGEGNSAADAGQPGRVSRRLSYDFSPSFGYKMTEG